MRKILHKLGLRRADPEVAEKLHEPYGSQNANLMYNLLFCDVPSLFFSKINSDRPDWLADIFSSYDADRIYAIAKDDETESRIRLLAYNWLRENNHPVPKSKLLGVVVEVPLEEGIDTLAAYLDGRVRYINQTEKMTIVEDGFHALNSLATDFVTVSSPILSQIGPWDEARLPPPEKGMIRLTFLAADGLYFGEGPFEAMQQNALSAPIVLKAIELLQAVVNESIEPRT